MAEESKSSYGVLFQNLKDRGLSTPRLIISDAHSGLVSAIRESFPGALWQRCKVHFMRNILAYVPQNLVPYITQTAAGLRECLSVFGNDYPTPDGSNIRDYIDVVDLAKAHVTAIARMIEGKNREKYEIFNIGTGRGVSVLELVRKFEEVNNLKLNYKIVGRRAGDIVAIWADPSYANDELGWKAERSLDQTLAAAWKWEKHIRGIE